MSLSTLIQILCHHVLANEIDLNLKYCIGIKQFFNINLGISIIKKLFFLFIFSTYLHVFLLKFWVGELLGCKIKFRIQRVPTLHSFDGPHYPKNKKYMKKRDDDIQRVPTLHTFDGPHYPKNKKYLKKTWSWHHHHVFSGISCF